MVENVVEATSAHARATRIFRELPFGAANELSLPRADMNLIQVVEAWEKAVIGQGYGDLLPHGHPALAAYEADKRADAEWNQRWLDRRAGKPEPRESRDDIQTIVIRARPTATRMARRPRRDCGVRKETMTETKRREPVYVDLGDGQPHELRATLRSNKLLQKLFATIPEDATEIQKASVFENHIEEIVQSMLVGADRETITAEMIGDMPGYLVTQLSESVGYALTGQKLSVAEQGGPVLVRHESKTE